MATDKTLLAALASQIQSILSVSAKYRNDLDKHTARQLAICVLSESEELYKLVPTANNIFDLAEVFTIAYLKGE